MDDSDPMVESDPMAELAKQNAKYIKNCTELHLADRRIQRLAGFGSHRGPHLEQKKR